MSELIETYRGMVFPWHCDHMGHMNVMWYVGKFDEATWNLFATAGATAAYLREHKLGMAAVQQNITYKRELHAGDTLTVRSAFLEVREKVAKFVHEMRHATRGEIAAVCVLTGVSLDLQTRKSCPLPAALLTSARKLIRQYDI